MKNCNEACQEVCEESFPISCSNKAKTGNENDKSCESCEILFFIPTDHLILMRALNQNPKILDGIKISRGVEIWVHPNRHVAHVLGKNHVEAKEDILELIKGLK